MMNSSMYFGFIDYTALVKFRQSSRIIENHVILKIIRKRIVVYNVQLDDYESLLLFFSLCA